MKKIYSLFIAFLFCSVAAFSQTLIPVGDELILPSYAYYGGTSVGVANRMPFVCRLKLTGLIAGATYRYVSGMSSTSTHNTTQAPGNMYRINNGSHITAGHITGLVITKAINSSEIQSDMMNTTNSSFHGRFTADASGNYTGWFSVVPTGNITQQANGSDVYFYIGINDGTTGITNTSLARSYRTTSTVKLLNYSNVPGNALGCTALVGTSDVADEKIVTIYDNTASSGRPLYCTFTENNNNGGALNEGTLWNNPQIYGSVDGVSGKWAAIIPNSLSGGVQAINFLNIADGSPITLSNSPTPNTSANGIWNGVSTANPVGDSTAPIVINSIVSSVLPVNLISFKGMPVKEGIKLSWETAEEINNKYFELRKAAKDGQFITIATINGSGNSQVNNYYNFIDQNPFSGTNLYQLKQVNLNGSATSYPIISVKYGGTSNHIQLISSTSNQLNISVGLSEAKTGNIIFADASGKIIYTRQASLIAGENVLKIPVQTLSKQLGIISFVTKTERMSLKVLL